MRRMMSTVLLTLAVFAAACGRGGGGSGDASSDGGREPAEANGNAPNGDPSPDLRRDYAEAMAAADDLPGEPTEEEQVCMGFALVDAVGVDQITEAGGPDIFDDPDAQSLTDLGISFDQQQADAFWEDLNECFDVRQAFFEGMRAGPEIPEEAVRCLEREFDDDLMKRVVMTAIVEGEDALDRDEQLQEELFDIGVACGLEALQPV